MRNYLIEGVLNYLIGTHPTLRDSVIVNTKMGIRRIAVFGVLVVTFALGPTATAFASKPVATTTVDESWTGCSVTVTYTWDGFHGAPKYSATLGVVDVVNGGLGSGGWSSQYSSGAVSPRNGSFQHTFDLVTLSSGTHNLYVFGRLMDTKDNIVTASIKTSTDVSAHGCGVSGAPGT